MVVSEQVSYWRRMNKQIMIIENRMKPALNVRMPDLNDFSPDMEWAESDEGVEKDEKSFFGTHIFASRSVSVFQFWYWNGL